MIAVRKYEEVLWQLITIGEWWFAEKRAGSQSAFAETRAETPEGFDSLEDWVTWANSTK